MIQKRFDVIPECYVDTNLIEYLTNAHVNHQHSCTKVVGLLNSKFKDQFAVGIIDKDKVKMGYLNECEEIGATPHLTLLKHRERHQYIITIQPAVDRFILDCAEQEGIKPEDYNLPSKLKEFTKVSKAVTSNSDSRFRNLFKAIDSNIEFQILRASLDYMIQSKYTTDPNTLKSLFAMP